MNFFWKAGRYANYLLNAKNTHGIHSPFVFDLLNQVIYNSNPFYAFRRIEAYRKSLELNNTVIVLEDHGAGSSYGSSRKRTVAKILRQSVKSRKYAQLLFRLAEQRKPDHIVELGTSLGITTLYLSFACPKAKITTIEASVNVAGFAKQVFEKFKRKNIELKQGTFMEVIPETLREQKAYNFVFFDGHHDKDATLNYFSQFVSNVDDDALYVFDDIHWSEGMEEAWEKIKEHDKVTLTIDLFEMGLVFFMPRNQKEHFVIRF